MAHVGKVVIGSVPAAVLGLLLDDWAHDNFYSAYTVAAMLILYGIIFIVIERYNRRRKERVLGMVEKPIGKHGRVKRLIRMIQKQ